MEDAAKRIGEAIAALERECGLDWRFSFSKLKPLERGRLEVELSREELWRRLPARLDGFSVIEETKGEHVVVLSDGGLVVELSYLFPERKRPLWVVSSVADVRRESSHSAELLTQLIMGETAFPLKAEGDWFLVRLSDDYHGWVRSWCVREADSVEIASYESETNAVVEASVGYVLSAADMKSLPVSDIVAGTKLFAAAPTGGFRAVALPGGKRGFMREGDLAEKDRYMKPDRNRLVASAMRFTGIPYLWGGTTPKGFDCSGLVMRVFLMEGVALPRDSDRQALAGSALSQERMGDSSPGDLLFFGEGGKVGHVGISLGKGRFIHASGEVRFNSLLEGDELYDERFSKIFLFARSILP